MEREPADVPVVFAFNVLEGVPDQQRDKNLTRHDVHVPWHALQEGLKYGRYPASFRAAQFAFSPDGRLAEGRSSER
jgi:hypothetical protein